MPDLEIFSEKAAKLVWGPALLLLVLLGGTYFTVASGFYPIRKIGFILKSTFGKIKKKSGGFAAMTTALGATAGTGNIVGVAAAIAAGGAGAVFWMWIGAFLGMMLKFAEAALAVEHCGGAMKYIEHAAESRLPSLLWCGCCVLASFGTGNMIQTCAAAEICQDSLGIPPIIIGGGIALLVFSVIFCGANAVTKASALLVPFMSGFYLFGCVLLLYIHKENIPMAVSTIFSDAFSPLAAEGGAIGLFTSKALQVGISRGTFTHEAGMGSASVAHSESKNCSPTEQGCWGIAEVFLDTMIFCTATALVVLSSNLSTVSDNSAAVAFEQGFGSLGGIFIGLSMFFFALAAVLGWAFYGEKALAYLTNSKGAVTLYRIIFCLCAAIGSVLSVPVLWNLSDIFNGLMIFPNMTALFLLRKEIIKFTKRKA